MTVELAGALSARQESELVPPVGPAVQPAFIRSLARQYEAAGFGTVWIGQSATSVDAIVIAQAALAVTDRLGVVVTLPSDVLEPVAAARAVATLAGVYPGRVQARVPPGPRHSARPVEFGTTLRALWRARQPLDHNGEHYRFERAWSVLRPDPSPGIVAHATTDGSLDRVIASYADVMVLPAAKPGAVAARIAELADLADERLLRFALAVRPLVGDNLAALADRTRRLAQTAPVWAALDDASGEPMRSLGAMTGAGTGVEPFIGTVDAIARRLAEYRSAGVSLFQLRGFDPHADVAVHSAVAAAMTGPQQSTTRGRHVDVA